MAHIASMAPPYRAIITADESLRRAFAEVDSAIVMQCFDPVCEAANLVWRGNRIANGRARTGPVALGDLRTINGLCREGQKP